MHACIHQNLTKTCYAPGTILGSGDKAESTTKQKYESSARFYSAVLEA